MGLLLSGLILAFFYAILPSALVAFSARSSGSSKGVWFLVAFFLSWVGYVAFLVATASKAKS